MEGAQARSRGSVGIELKAWDGGHGEGEGEDQIPQVQKKSLLQRAQDKLAQTLPTFSSVDINDLKVRGVAVWLAGPHLVLYLTLVLYLLYAGTISEYNKQYLALTNDKGNSICEKIGVPVTETFKADKNGTWITSKFYDPLSTIYELKMTGTTVTDERYSAVMRNFMAQFKIFGETTTSLDIIGQQIAWSMFSVRDSDTMMELSTDADLGSMLGSVEPGFPDLSSAEGVCMYEGLRPTFNSQGLVLTASFPANAPPSAQPTPLPTAMHEPTAEPYHSSGANDGNGGSSYYEFCPKQIYVGHDTFGLKYSDKSLNIDLFNAALAFALNFGIVNTSSLTKTYFSGEVGKGLFEVWTSDRYPGSSVDCYTKTGQPRVCFATYGDTSVYPVLTTTTNSWGETPERLCPCLCPEDAKTKDCNSNSNFQLALVFPKDGESGGASIFSAGLKLQSMLKTDGPNEVKSLVAGLAYTVNMINDYSFREYYSPWPRAFYANWLKGKKKIDGVPPYSEFKKSFELMGPGISIMSFDLRYDGKLAPLNAGGVKLKDLATTMLKGKYNETYSQVSCTDTIFQLSALQHMSLVPPLSVVQPYLSCHPSLARAFLTAAGLAAANSALISSIFLSLFVATTVFYFNNIHKSAKLKIVAPAEKSLQMAETVKMLEAEVSSLRAKSDEASKLTSRVEMLERMLRGDAGLDVDPAMDRAGFVVKPVPVPSQQRLTVSGNALGVFGENPMHRGGSIGGSTGGRNSLGADDLQQKHEALMEQREKVEQAELRLSRDNMGNMGAK